MDYNSEESTVLDFDTNVEPKQSFDPLPDADYLVNIVKTSIKPTSKKDGKRISVELAVDESHEEYKGRRVFCNFNVINPNETAQEIGRREYAGLLHAVGKVGERDVSTLVGCQVLATVRTQEAQGKYEANNFVKKFSAVGGAASAPPSAPKPPATKAPPAFMNKPTLAK